MPSKFLINDFYRGVIQELQEKLSSFWARAENQAANAIIDIVDQAIKDSQEYQLLSTNSREHGEIGIPDIQARMDVIIKAITDDIRLTILYPKGKGGVTAYRDSLKATFKIQILNLNYQNNILKLPEAQFLTDPSKLTGQTYNLEWLKWLLLEGTQPVILDYHYLSQINKNSRTGLGIMIGKGYWQVPASIAGTAGNNWLTRAITGIQNKLPSVVENIFKENLT